MSWVVVLVKVLYLHHLILSPVDDSVVLKVISIYNKDTDTIEEVLLEELQVFKVLLLFSATIWQKMAIASITHSWHSTISFVCGRSKCFHVIYF